MEYFWSAYVKPRFGGGESFRVDSQTKCTREYFVKQCSQSANFGGFEGSPWSIN